MPCFPKYAWPTLPARRCYQSARWRLLHVLRRELPSKAILKITPDVIDLDQASGNDRKQQGQLGFCAPLRESQNESTSFVEDGGNNRCRCRIAGVRRHGSCERTSRFGPRKAAQWRFRRGRGRNEARLYRLGQRPADRLCPCLGATFSDVGLSTRSFEPTGIALHRLRPARTRTLERAAQGR